MGRRRSAGKLHRMRRNATPLLILTAVFLLIVALNFIFFIDARAQNETEENGDRSSYRATPFGTKAFYSFLEESGYKPARFEKPYTSLKHSDPGTLFIISPPDQNPISEDEFQRLTKWIDEGGLAIVVDREINITLGEANIKTERPDGKQPVKVLQPTPLTRGVERLSLSDFATRVRVSSKAVTYHIGDGQAAVLADITIGKGRAILLTDPHVVANNGISESDNFTLALNLLGSRPEGRIAFDEYHHGYGSSGDSSGFMGYFRGTPVPWMFWQVALILLMMVYTFGRRFARPLPLRHAPRTTNLEFVSSMANIIRIARATDLAMTNIYSEFRKRLCRFCGLPPRIETPKLIAAAARRGRLDERELRTLMARCEAITQRKPVNDSELLKLVTRIREIEAALKV